MVALCRWGVYCGINGGCNAASGQGEPHKTLIQSGATPSNRSEHLPGPPCRLQPPPAIPAVKPPKSAATSENTSVAHPLAAVLIEPLSSRESAGATPTSAPFNSDARTTRSWEGCGIARTA